MVSETLDPMDADLPGERWAPIAGFELDYAVSTMGRVKRTSRAPRTRPGKILKCPQHRVSRYRCVTLVARNKRRHARVHHLVCEAFIGPRPPGGEVNHLNGDKGDPRLENLEYTTRRGNALHAARVLGRFRGSNSGRAKIDEADALAIRERLARGDRQVDIGADYGICQTAVSSIKRGKAWRHVL